MKILVTGAAGFIGFYLVKALIESENEIVGIDNISKYYDVNLKYARLRESGINCELIKDDFKLVKSTLRDNYKFAKVDITNFKILKKLFENEKFTHVINLAAQPGVRYSLENPHVYAQSNIIGFLNILECSHKHNIQHLVYASSSSVYGNNTKIPFSEEDRVDHPISLYAATKKSNELMAHTYSHLYNLPTTGLRFFTVYGPWGRPDMAMFLFTDAIENGRPIKVFNYGKMERDFTYITDIVEGIKRILLKPTDDLVKKNNLYKIYNIGKNNSQKLLDFIEEIELNLGKKAKKVMMATQPGDVVRTWANVDPLIKEFDYKPSTTIKEGVKEFVSWYKEYYNKT